MTTVDHDGFLDRLLTKFRVYLVNRYADDGLEFDDTALRVFLPDLHWITTDATQQFPNYHFNGITGNLFAHLLDVLQGTENVKVHQTGDRLDFWRASNPSHPTPEDTFQAIVTDPTIGPLHAALRDFSPLLVRGNHDGWMSQITDDGPCPETSHDPTGKIFLTHGHIWDQVERLPLRWKEWAVSIAKDVTPHTYNVGPIAPGTQQRLALKLKVRRRDPGKATPLTVSTTGAVPLGKADDATAITDAYLDISEFQIASLSSAFDDFHDVAGIVTFGGDVRERAQHEGQDCRLFVIGHTHHARLLVDKHPLGGPLATMDCGAWIENCTVQGEKPLPSAQFGVQYGNDLRIYQIAPRN